MTLDALLIGARFLHFAVLTALFGAALFPLYAGRLVVPNRAWIAWTSAGALITALFWLAAVAASMSGDLTSALDPAILWTVAFETAFGKVWLARIALGLALVVVALATRRERLIVGLAGVLLASIALTGHARLPSGPLGAVHAASDALHLLAAGAWLGALVPLGRLTLAPMDEADVATVLRFSRTGVAAVATILGTGLFNGWLLAGAPERLVSTLFGRVLMVKVALFGAMLLLAALNRFWVTPALVRGEGDRWRMRLRRHVAAEQALGLLVLMAASVLGVTAPAVMNLSH